MTARWASPPAIPDGLFIDGLWRAARSASEVDVVDSATEEVAFTVALAGPADLDEAIGAARRAFDDGMWPLMSHDERSAYITAFAAALRAQGEAFAQIWSRQTGVVYAHARNSAENAAAVFDYYAGLAGTFPFEEVVAARGGSGTVIREPVGVVGAIIAWNGPLHFISAKVAPALLAGCTIVLKLSPEAPGEGLLVAQIAHDIGLPPGVLNVVTADRQVSELLVTDSRVDKITFTGSTAAGRRIASLAGQRIARCTLELGGKSPAVLLDDADLGVVVDSLTGGVCRIAGQVCSTLSRVIVPRELRSDLVQELSARLGSLRVGDPFDDGTQVGPLATKVHRERVRGYIQQGLESGATLATGGGDTPMTSGWYVEPTLFTHVDAGSAIAQEEIFGPVLCVIESESTEESIRLANGTIYGLNAAVFTQDEDRGFAVARKLRSGTVGVNASRTGLDIAFGGFKQSGIGREGGVEGLRSYLETKVVRLG